jgi:hypothetical protein
LYRPEQRQIPCHVLTRAGWISGSFHLPAKNVLVDFLNRPGEFVNMTEVAIQGRVTSLPFLALHRESMMLIVPPAGETNLQISQMGQALEEKPLTCLLESGVLSGRIRVHPGLRVSDFFHKLQGFVLVSSCRLLLRGGEEEAAPLVKEPHLIVNTDWVLGVADGSSGATPAAGE